jgi:subtilase family protein
MRRTNRWIALASLFAVGGIVGILRPSLLAHPGDAEILLVQERIGSRGGNLGSRLAANGVAVLANYDTFALASVTAAQRARLEREGLELSFLPGRTTTGRGGFVFDTRTGEPSIPTQLRTAEPGDPRTAHYIVQFIGPVKPEWLRSLDGAGVRRFDYLPSNSFVVAMNRGTALRVRGFPFVQWVGVYHAAYKMDRSLLDARDGERPVRAGLFPGEDTARLEASIASWGATVAERWDEAGAKRIRTSLPAGRVLDLAQMDEVAWIEDASGTPSVSNSSATWVVQSNQNLNRSIFGHGLHGEGQYVTFAEGEASSTHPALVGKVEPPQIIAGCGNQAGNPDPHATAVASVLAGNYTPSTSYDCQDGHAYAATLLNVFMGLQGGCSISDCYNNVYAPSYARQSRVHAEGPDEDHLDCVPTYCSGAEQLDHFVWDHKDFLITMPAGNNGGSITSDKRIRCTAQAKNLITVGASWNGADANKMASYSSWGPACDGRQKPTLIAPGGQTTLQSPINVASTSASTVCGTNPNNKYGKVTGTSFSHPAVAGSAALVRQYFTEGWYPSGTKIPGDALVPSAALTKAVLINGAVEMTDVSAYEECAECPYPECNPPTCDPIRVYPNRVQGWGRILLENSLYFSGDPAPSKLTVFDEPTGLTASGQEKEYRILVTAGTSPFGATLVWTDPPAAVGAPSALVNNLDLIVKDPACTVYRGNGLSEGQSFANGAADPMNVEERVLRFVAPQGVWSVTVRGSNLIQTPQPFAIAATGLTGTVLAAPPYTTAAGEHMTGLETIVSGSYVDTGASDDSREILKEVLSGGVSRLSHVWRFDGVPLGSCITLNVEGQRTAGSDSDDFKFSWSESLNGTYTDIPNAVIKKTYELTGGINYPFARTNTSGTLYIKVEDTNQSSGTGRDQVKIDRLEIR